MLTELHIKDLAIIDELELRLDGGLITFTGETGAGKSIVVDAIEMLLGQRAESQLLRTGAARALVEGVFQIEDGALAAVRALLEREGLLDDPEYVTLGRELRREGRSIARVNGRTVPLALLRELGEQLVDLHGQSDHLSLLRPREHLALVDRYAEIDTPLAAYRTTFDRLQAVRQDAERLRQSERELAQRADLLAWQTKEIDAAQLSAGEEESLTGERSRLANAEELATLARTALAALDESTADEPTATDLVGRVVRLADRLAELDPEQRPAAEQARLLAEGLADLAGQWRSYLETVEADPGRLERIEQRLDVIYHLKRKYGDSVAAVLQFAAAARRELDGLTRSGERLAQLEAEEQQLLAQLAEHGRLLTRKRRAAAERLRKAMEKELADLRMTGTRLSVDVQQTPDPAGVLGESGVPVAFHPRGLDQVEFMLAANAGEEFKPLARTASGGETARLMLALKTVLARADQTPTLIFDEIDQGIGGRVGIVVGRKLASLAQNHQVLCITHLPQVAAFGAQHFRVEKVVRGKRTETRVACLDDTGRVHELAQMLGDITEANLQSAGKLLETARGQTE